LKKPKKKKVKKKRRAIGPPVSKRNKAKFAWLNVLPYDQWVKVRKGRTVMEALQKTDVDLEGDCGGVGKCGKCKIKVISAIGPPSDEAKELLTEEELRKGIRLACRTKIKKDLTIYVGESEEDMEYFQILKTGYRPDIETDPLVKKKPVFLVESAHPSDFDRIKSALGPEYQNLKAPLSVFRGLPDLLKKTESRGTAVLHGLCLLDWQKWEHLDRQYGLVFDLGTSTLVGKLVDLIDGNEVTVVSCMNSQMRFGTDVISRLKYVKEHIHGLNHLHHLLVRDLNMITARLLKAGGLKPEDVHVAVAAGNTTMQHLFLGMNPLGIAEAPFTPVVTEGLILKAGEAGLRINPEAVIYVLPVKSAYIGGDLISVILASGAAEQDDELILGLDFGTNGEIFLGNRRRLMTCSAAGGPALEGAKISHGMIAKAGAIEGVRIEQEGLRYQVIGNIKPKGICGSGLADLVAVLLHCGLIDHEGLIRNGEENGLNWRVIEKSGICDFLVASEEESYEGRPVYLTQKDVREIQLAKGAIAAGIKILMGEMGVGVGDIAHVYLAGAFGNYVNPYSAMRVGLIPRVNPEIIRSLGNAASTGASMVLLSRPYWHAANEIADFIEHVELSTRRDFSEVFVEQMDFPMENLW